MRIAFLLVTCCLEQSRVEVLADVIRRLQEQAPELHEHLTVFDNASTVPGVVDTLRDCFTHVYQADRNVGYWSAIDWWLDHLSADPPAYTYIIESDMLHYDFQSVYKAADFLGRHPDLGAVRVYEYSIANRHLYNKDKPVPGSQTHAWQSHTNAVTGARIIHELVEEPFYKTNFLTILPSVNRYDAMVQCFDKLRQLRGFSEPDFRRLYHDLYTHIALHDGGIFHCRESSSTSGRATGSWSSPQELVRLGYQPTRQATITPRDQYNVVRL